MSLVKNALNALKGQAELLGTIAGAAAGKQAGKLGKLTFIFYPVSAAPGVGVTYVPQYNPSTFNVSHSVKYDTRGKVSVGNLVKKFFSTEARTLSLELLFDGTGASPSTTGGFGDKVAVNANTSRVDEQIDQFMNYAYRITGAIHRPNYVMVVWGTFIMTGVLESASVNYTMFAPDGTPLRAKMSVTIKEHVDFSLLVKALKLQSPDISKTITVSAGDTLPLLCYREYGDASLYTRIAQVNNLKNPRKLTQGTELLFPPIDKL